MKLHTPTPIEEVHFEGKEFLIKRDDLISYEFSGNKARKFRYFLSHDFSFVKTLLSYGSSQSNAMYSLSVLAKIRGWHFIYYVDHLSSFLAQNPHGNYAYALQNGMELRLGAVDESLKEQKEVLFIEEGGRLQEASYGILELAQEIKEACKGEKVDIFLPSGTGTTALFLQKYLPSFRVYTTPCVGNADYLQKQFLMLESDTALHPQILTTQKKYHFGKLYREFFKIWVELTKQTGIVFDLLYDPKGWLTLLENEARFNHKVLYIHQGGLLGNESMLKRYERKKY